MSEFEIGHVKLFNESKGMGFIESTKGETVFVHRKEVQGEASEVLQEGQKVKFLVKVDHKGSRAYKVELSK